MTDSENETNPGIFPFETVDTTVNAFGPNIKYQRPFQFPNNGSSSIFMPRRNYAESVYEQRRYNRRGTSPMSTHSAVDTRPWNFSQYYNGIHSTQSVFNGRCGSTMSVRSVDSTASVADIISALKNNKFSKHDERAIEEAVSKWRRQRRRNRIQRRRNMRFHRKDSRYGEDYDSGEQGSNSSISSHNSHSETISCNENGISANVDMINSRKTIKDTNAFMDHSQGFRQQTSKNMFSANSNSFKDNQNFKNSLVSKQPHIVTQQERFKNGVALPSQRFNSAILTSVNFNKSEIYKKTNNNNEQNEKLSCALNSVSETDRQSQSDSEEEIFSGINKTIREKITHDWLLQNKKRSIQEPQNKRHRNSDDDLNLPNGKRLRTLSPTKNYHLQVAPKTSDINTMNNNFEFTRPLLPVRKSKTKVHEKVTSKQPTISPIKSSAHINKVNNSDTTKVGTNPEKSEYNVHIDHSDNVINVRKSKTKVQEKVTSKQPTISPIKSSAHINKVNNSTTKVGTNPEKSEYNVHDHSDNVSNQSNDVSMRPSFIKRKLFTQKLDIAEKANTSNDSSNSPHKNVYAMQKEKNKARKLVTTQSCLNRDVQEDNNYLDLIHKFMPPSCITNQSMTSQIKEKTVAKNDDDDDKWDVTSIITACNENDGSDTFTDEDIFNTNTNKKQSNTKQKININVNNKCTVNLQKLDVKKCTKGGGQLKVNKCVSNLIPNNKTEISNDNLSKTVGKSLAQKFWESDFETDVECDMTLQKSTLQENQTRDNIQPTITKPEEKRRIPSVETSPMSKSVKIKNKISTNSILDSTGKLNINLISLRTHRTSKKKICCNQTCPQEITSKPQAKNTTPKKQIKSIQNIKTITPIRSNKNNTLDLKANTLLQSNRNKKTETPNKTKQKVKSNANKENIYKAISYPIRRSPRIKSMKNNQRPQRSCRTSGSAVI